MKLQFALLLAASAMTLTGCISGAANTTKPTVAVDQNSNTIVVAQSRDAVWSAAVPNLGKHFFVINNVDKSSGLINVSYSGNPEKYVDCGTVHSEVSNLRGQRVYDFAGATPDVQYEFFANSRIFQAHRKMSLEGRVNLIFENIDANHTRVTASTQYVVRKDLEYLMIGAVVPGHSSDTISFTSGNSASFPNSPTTCAATGALETQLLSLVRGQPQPN